jgi:hypothetical protein
LLNHAFTAGSAVRFLAVLESAFPEFTTGPLWVPMFPSTNPRLIHVVGYDEQILTF